MSSVRSEELVGPAMPCAASQDHRSGRKQLLARRSSVSDRNRSSVRGGAVVFRYAAMIRTMEMLTAAGNTRTVSPPWQVLLVIDCGQLPPDSHPATLELEWLRASGRAVSRVAALRVVMAEVWE